MGTREHIVAYLAEVSELFDASGMASTKLAAAVGYPGSSVAFAQLLSGMERSGLIEREVRGKRTYRIRLGLAQTDGSARRASGADGSAGVDVAAGVGRSADGHGSGVGHGPDGLSAASGSGGVSGSAPGFAAGPAGFDYDELARRLLAQVVRRLAGTEPAGTGPTAAWSTGPGPAGAGPAGAGPAGTEPAAGQTDSAALRERVASLEHDLASAWAKHGKLAEENVRLREQLQATQRSLALARESLRRLPSTADLDSAEVMLLQRLLAPARDTVG